MEGRDDNTGLAAPLAHGEAALDDASQGVPPHGEDVPAPRRSLGDDLEALIEDAKTYLDAELSYQKSRAGFVANRLKQTIGYGLVAIYFAILATIGLTVGLIIALTPYLAAWGATAVVILLLLLVTMLMVWRASKAWKSLMGAMQSDEEEPGDNG